VVSCSFVNVDAALNYDIFSQHDEGNCPTCTQDWCQEKWLLKLVRTTEFTVAGLARGQRAAGKLKAAHGLYDCFHANTWDFEGRHLEQTPQILIETARRCNTQQRQTDSSGSGG
jgi:hypothetical protein